MYIYLSQVKSFLGGLFPPIDLSCSSIPPHIPPFSRSNQLASHGFYMTRRSPNRQAIIQIKLYFTVTKCEHIRT